MSTTVKLSQKASKEIQSSRSEKILWVRGKIKKRKKLSRTIVPRPLIFRPDLETDGFWSVRTGAASRSFLHKLIKYELTCKQQKKLIHLISLF